MSIRQFAVELYKAQQKVHKLQNQLETATLNEKDTLRAELRQAQAECTQLRRLIEAEKEPSTFRNSFLKR